MPGDGLVRYQICLKFVSGDSSLSSDHIKATEETHLLSLMHPKDPTQVNLSQIMALLDQETQSKMEGKIISYFHNTY